jgi:ABC-type amino acid transport system permease subunit
MDAGSGLFADEATDMLDVPFIISIIPRLMYALVLTILVSAVSLVLGTLLGLTLGIAETMSGRNRRPRRRCRWSRFSS